MSARAFMRRGWVVKAFGLLAVGLALGWGSGAYGQTNTRQVLSSGTGVPGHGGFVFGAFSNLAMNEAKEIVFLSTLRSARIELRAVVRSTGVTFSVIAFQGLRSPVQRTVYESFSAASINPRGVVAFTAQLKDEVPASAVFRQEGAATRVVAITGSSVPGTSDATFQEFSAPLVNSVGNVLFGARVAGKIPGSGLFLWTPERIRSLAVPAELNLTPNDLLEPVYVTHDEAVFVVRGTPVELATEQFFRAVAVKSFQELKPQPRPSDMVEVVPARPGEKPVKMLLVLMEGENIQTALLVGDPSQPVMAKRQHGITLKPLGRILGQTTEARGNSIFASATANEENDLALYCYCEGEVTRLTSPEEFLAIRETAGGRTISSLSGDSQHTVAFILPGGPGGDSGAIYVTSVP